MEKHENTPTVPFSQNKTFSTVLLITKYSNHKKNWEKIKYY